jgi:Amt family ammonium transporter
VSAAAPPAATAGDTAWLLVATALVLLMVPGLALFYGGLVRGKSALNTMLMSVAALALVSVQWVLVGYSLAFSPGTSLIGGLAWRGLAGVGAAPEGTYAALVPHALFAAYQMMFAGITVAIVSGAVVERMRFGAFLAFGCSGRPSSTTRSPTGCGATAGGCARSARSTSPAARWCTSAPASPRSSPRRRSGVGVGSARSRRCRTTCRSPPRRRAALGGVVRLQRRLGARRRRAGGERRGHDARRGVGGAARLDRPRAGARRPPVGRGRGHGRRGRPGGHHPGRGVRHARVGARHRGARRRRELRRPARRGPHAVDDSLDVFACHGVAGIVGALLTGVFATRTVNPAGADGLLAGNPRLLGVQLVAVLATMAFAGGGAAALLALVRLATPLRVPTPDEIDGVDVSEHGERAYHGDDVGDLAGRGMPLGGVVVLPSAELGAAFAPEPVLAGDR